jgi:type I restriction enzyme S subunit
MVTKQIKISDLFNIEKGTIQSSKNIPGNFNFITASAEWKTHNEYSHDCEAIIFAMGAAGSLGRTHYVNGKFVASDLCFILTPKSETEYKIDLKFYYRYFNLIREEIVKKTATGTSKLAINIKNFSKYEILFPTIEEQKKARFLIENIQPKSFALTDVIYQSLEDILILRQSILQEAVQGKLVPQDPNDEPAGVLLKNIKAEKERLKNEKIIKKEKPLPPITEDEIPYELPSGWEWVRLGDICSTITDGTHQTPNYVESGMMFLSAQNIKPYKFMPDNHRSVSYEDYLNYTKNVKPEINDILITRVGAGIGEAAIIDQNLDFAIYVSLGLIKPINQLINNRYLLHWINSPEGTLKSFQNTYGRGTSQGNLNLNLIRNFLVSLPSLNEQRRIVEEVDRLLALCDELHNTIEQLKREGEMLMHAVLQEAFSRSERAHNIIEFPTSSSDDTEDEWDMVARADEISPETQAEIADVLDEIKRERR